METSWGLFGGVLDSASLAEDLLDALVKAQTCDRCHGLGKVFRCPEWEKTFGECCPEGSHKASCPGRSFDCRACDGSGIAHHLGEQIDATALEKAAEALGGSEWEYSNDKPRFRREAKDCVIAYLAAVR
jgi:hypothetical protein